MFNKTTGNNKRQNICQNPKVIIQENVQSVMGQRHDVSQSVAIFREVSPVMMNWSSGPQNENQINMEERSSNFTVSTVPADGLAPPGAKASAGTAMTKLRSRI